MVLKWLKVLVLGAALACPLPSTGPVLTGVALAAASPFAAAAAILLTPDPADARAGRSSGGYSRPGGSVSRTPSFGSSSTRSRTPSTSSGYSRPSGGSGSGGFFSGAPSASDRTFSRQSSGEALDRYRAQQRPPEPDRTITAPPQSPSYPAPFQTPSYGGGSRRYGGGYGGSSYGGGYGGWQPPPYISRSQPRFGIWDGLFLWFLLDNLSRPGNADFFHNHQNDPGYAQWRQEAEKLAADNADLRAKLQNLDSQLAEKSDQPRDPDYLPPGVTPTEALAADARDSDGGGWLLTSALVGGAVLVLFLYWRRQSSRRPRSSPGGGDTTVDKLKSAADIVRHKMSGERYTPSLFRVGMTLTLDPTPFILAAGATKVAVPDVAGGNQLVSVQAVGTVNDGSTTLHRLYLPENRGFFQLHLDAAGNPDECRFFAPLDEINPGSPDEWGFWLDPQEGMIGWPEFQTKDGKLYPRLWASGSGRTPPRNLNENIAEAERMRIRKSQAMLYGAPTGLADPAPQAEYILVAAVEESGQAWIEVLAGIDINPAALSLS
jgi:hypothetical protein